MLRLIHDSALTGATNMARDEALLATATTPVLRLYDWQPACLSLGLFQDYERVMASLGQTLPVVRRITGGGTIYHIHEVTYAIVGRLGCDGFPERLRDCYGLFHGRILAELARRGADLRAQAETVGDRRYFDEVRCFASPAADDLVSAAGGKVLGSAGRNRDGRFLVHGSLKLASNPWDREAVAGCGCEAPAARAALIAAFSSICPGPLHEGTYSSEELTTATTIEAARYSDHTWVHHRQGPRP